MKQDIVIGSTLHGLLRAVNLNESSPRSKVLIVGQNPSIAASGKNNTFDRLNGWVEQLGLEDFAFINACSKHGKIRQSDVDLDNLVKAVYSFDRVLAVGNFPSESLHRLGKQHFKLPHPSPLNRQINDPVFINNCLNECRLYLENV